MESRWSPKTSERDFRGQNSMSWDVFYIIGKLLKLRCLKWARIAHLHIWNISNGQKKGRESNSNWQFDSRPLKVGNQPDSLRCRCRATYCWKFLDEGYNFTLDFISIGGLLAKLWRPKVAGTQLWQFRDSHLGVLGQKVIWMWASWRGVEYTIRGKVVASPKSRLWWVLCVRIARGSS
jgi:hypothetical protein